MKTNQDNLDLLNRLHKSALEAYSNFAVTSEELYQAVQHGARNLELNQRLEAKNTLADRLVAIAREVSEERENFVKNGGNREILKEMVTEFNESLQPILAELMRIEKGIEQEMKRSGVKIAGQRN